MKAHLLYPDRDFAIDAPLVANHEALTQDLELAVLFKAMAHEDEFILDVVQKVILSAEPVTEKDIRHRQSVLADCDSQAAVVREIYDLVVETLAEDRKITIGLFRDSPSAVINRSIESLTLLMGMLRRLWTIADRVATDFHSEGFLTLFSTLKRELSDDYFAEVATHLKRLKFDGGVLIGAELDDGNKGTNYVLRTPPKQPNPIRQFIDWVLNRNPPQYTFRMHPRDEAGAQALSRLQDRGLAVAAQAVAESAAHVLSFFRMLRVELSFYIACGNLHGTLREMGCRTAMPEPEPRGDYQFDCRGLYDVCLALQFHKRIVGNTIAATGKRLTVVTGANQGGKTTFLRSAGLAQVMMQAGMFVSAERFRANLVSGVFTHFKREEDASMSSGKFDEELSRMSEIVDQIEPHGLMLFNESFASTNEREGSEIARQIVEALLKDQSKVFFVTHMFELASTLRRADHDAIFLRAERNVDGQRSFQLAEGDPLPTSYGEDLYREIFGAAVGTCRQN